jgi:hypothetical protein
LGTLAIVLLILPTLLAAQLFVRMQIVSLPKQKQLRIALNGLVIAKQLEKVPDKT